ncbi:MAG: hypothetical protein Q7R86_01050 [bacterium]|nr:hypothetical protein [bacterium]
MKSQGFIILLAFLALSILGFSSLAHKSQASGHGCIFALSENCTQAVDPVSSILGHITSLQKSTQANIGLSTASLLILSAFSLILTVGIFNTKRLKIFQSFYKTRTPENFPKPKIQFLAWLSTLAKQDALTVIPAR